MGLTSYPVSPMYWKAVKDRKWDEPTALLGLYFLTCRHRNLEGLYSLPKGYITADQGWTLEELEPRFQKILETGFVKYDTDAEVILLPKALSYYTPKSDRQIQGAMNALQSVPDTNLWPHFLLAARTYATKFYEALGGDSELDRWSQPGHPIGTLPDTHPQPLPHTHSDGYPEAA